MLTESIKKIKIKLNHTWNKDCLKCKTKFVKENKNFNYHSNSDPKPKPVQGLS